MVSPVAGIASCHPESYYIKVYGERLQALAVENDVSIIHAAFNYLNGWAAVVGATVIEKHFTLRRADGGVDSAFSLEPEETAALVTETEHGWQALGEVRYGPTEAETASTGFRRSLYIAADLQVTAARFIRKVIATGRSTSERKKATIENREYVPALSISLGR
nr:N-acetylneuraminate synthase family protein [Nitrosococcus halophilus]